MQVRPKKSNKKILITITVILSLAVGGFVAYLYVTWPNDSSTDSSSSQTETKRPTDTNTNQTTNPTTNTPNTNSNNQEQTTVDGKTPVQYEGQTTETAPSTDNEQFRIPEGQ